MTDEADRLTMIRILVEIRDAMAAGFAAVALRFDGMEKRLGGIEETLGEMHERLVRVEYGLKDVKGIVVAGFLEQSRLAELAALVAQMRAEVDELKKAMKPPPIDLPRGSR